MSPGDPALLHIVNGDMAAGVFLHTFGAGDRLLINRDVLSCGPLPRSIRVAAWQRARLDFWRATLAHLRDFNFEPSPIDLLKNADRLRAPDIPCVWAATGNSDQLTISFVLHQVAAAGGDVSGVHVVQFETLPNSEQRVRGTGELSPEQLTVHPAPRKLSATELAAYRDAWVAVTSSDPSTVESFPVRHPNAPWYLRDAVSKMLRRYPDRASGLNYWDRRLLFDVQSKGPRAASVLAHIVEAMFDDGDLVGDLYIASRILAMSNGSLPRPLLSFNGSRQQVGRADVTLTEFGQEVTSGGASSYPVNPIDDWAGGVHVSSANGNLWFNDDGRIVRG
ncbi:MAG TPA: DUF1835 domain-containing protein [Steroidobacteraceae bacterium]